MLYLDYAADTPVCEAVLETLTEVSRQYIANANSVHSLGREAKSRLDAATQGIAGMLGVLPDEIIYTSGATESNNLAIKGACEKQKPYGRHIITTFLEHASVIGPVAALQSAGYEVDYVDIRSNGLVDISHLRELLRQDTVLVSVCAVDSEIGLHQPIGEIGALLSAYPRCVFHVDATQAVGKIPVETKHVDLMSFAPHKFNGMGGSGALVKKREVSLEPQMHGGMGATPFRSGTPSLALAAAMEKALSIALAEMSTRYLYVERLGKSLRGILEQYPKVRINSTENSVPFIMNISLSGMKSEAFREELENHGVCVSTRSACSAPNTVSRPVYALTRDRKAALNPLRISLSHQTSEEDIHQFGVIFARCYEKFAK